MIETTLVCAHTGKRQPIEQPVTVEPDAKLPGNWLHIPTIACAEEIRHDLHFLSYEALAEWAAAQAARQRLNLPMPEPVSILKRWGVPEPPAAAAGAK